MARTKKTETAAVEKTATTAAEETKAVKAAAKTPAKKATTRKVKAVESIYIQQYGSEISTADIAAKAKAESGVSAPKSVNIYVKPEENMVYYVVDEVSGSFSLC